MSFSFVRLSIATSGLSFMSMMPAAGEAAPVSAERSLVSCLATKQPDVLADLQSGLSSGKYSLQELRSFNDKSPPNDISFYMVQLLHKYCLAGNAPTPRLHENLLREEILQAKSPKSAEVMH